MEGWKISAAEYEDKVSDNDEIWRVFNYIFSSKSVNRTSYKFGFLKALLESVFEVDELEVISLDKIFSKFSHMYWSLIVKLKLKQGDKGVKGGKTKVEEIFESYIEQNKLIELCEYESIRDEVRNKIQSEITKECSKYVIGALYGDSGGVFYSFSKKLNYLQFNPKILNFMRKYNSVLLKLNHYEWIKFLEKVNVEENSYSIALKLDQAAKRINLKIYKDLLYMQLNTTTCFYCGKKVSYDKVHVDHFIPWSFIRNDKLWNFVISCSECNLSKNDRLTGKYFLYEIINRDNIIKYYDVMMVKEDFISYNEQLLKDIYKVAIFNGFNNNWNPKGIILPKEISLEDNDFIRI